MSETRRGELRKEAFAELLGYPASGLRSWIPRAPVKSAGDNVVGDCSWHFFAYSYSRAFDTLWDAARARPSAALDYPLLFVCRHSIELWLKSALSSVPHGKPTVGHGLRSLWSKLMEALTSHTGSCPDHMDGIDGDFANRAHQLIAMIDTHDNTGDRFRYRKSGMASPVLYVGC